MKTKDLLKDISIRYILAILIGFPGIYLIYKIFEPLTVYPTLFILKLLYSGTTLIDNVLVYEGFSIIIVPACIAGAAYYLLFALNLITPMKPKQRVYSLIFLPLAFLVLNIIRMVVFSSLFIEGYAYFDIAHQFFWYFVSIAMVAALWFVNVRLFKIKAIPFYTDFRSIAKLAKRKRR